jgi:hypothetical protein
MRIIKFRHGCYGPPRCIPLDTPGRVGDVVRLINGTPKLEVTKRDFVPHYDFQFIAKYKPESEREEYIQNCEQWFIDRGLRVPMKGDPEPVVERRTKKTPEHDIILAVYAKYHKKMISHPPLDELLEAYTRVGASEEKIEKLKNIYKKREEESEKNQSAIDKVFGKYPSTLKKTKEITKKKVIRAVKKKMPVNN